MEMIQAAEDHFEGDVIKGAQELFSNGIAKVNQNGKEQPSGQDLQENTVERAGPQISQVKQAFDDEEGFFDAPAATIQVSDNHAWPDGGVENASDIAIPRIFDTHFDQTQRIATGR